MIVLSHRGYWISDNEKNTVTAFKRSFELGFGTETDIRDLNGELVISHDIPVLSKTTIYVQEFFNLYRSYNKDLPLALNVKSDGLQTQLRKLLEKYEISNYFVFDMSIPDGLQYHKHGFNVFTRQSEYEVRPAYYDESVGVWLDEFKSHWISTEVIADHLKNNKKVCIVSPELHKRKYHEEWSDYKKMSNLITNQNNLMICTDKPEEARAYFK
ncbi:hypothetical protein DU508_22375 [Pedobacter chinensis]|uniref:Phosphodiesterase n=1 Tax=Pedobacter chinensis TaxID=2282421 RepID=A0A369PTE0_9SPHI|nr:hypothetical protein [Pedobacter chinensis]RDC54237.1 hypothetical protein DU508_22375 [Pedobacter chinensis]